MKVGYSGLEKAVSFLVLDHIFFPNYSDDFDVIILIGIIVFNLRNGSQLRPLCWCGSLCCLALHREGAFQFRFFLSI
jgi:hypothetical protein